MFANPTPPMRPITPDEQTALAVGILRGELSLESAADYLGMTTEEVESWLGRFLTTAQDHLMTLGVDEELTGKRQDRVGIWVCAVGDQVLAPFLFMQAVHPSATPQPIEATWGGVRPPPKPFIKRTAPLLSTCVPLDVAPNARIELYAATVPVARAFEDQTDLVDWRLPCCVNGIVLVLTGRQLPRAERRLFGRYTVGRDRTLAWVKRQRRPLVVAAMNRDLAGQTEEILRESCRIPSDAPILFGPALRRQGPIASHQPSQQSATARLDRMISSLAGGGDLRFDPSYARRVIEVLHDAMAQSNSSETTDGEASVVSP